MKKPTQKVIALALSAVMALSTFIYVGAADDADAAAQASEEVVIEDAAASDTALAAYSDTSSDETEEVVSADLLNSSYEEGEVIDYGLEGITVYAATALSLGSDTTGDYLRSSLSNVAYTDTDGNTISTRLLFKVVPSVTGNITVTSGATGKTGYVLEETATEGVFVVTSTTASADTIMGFLTAGKTYYIAYSGTNPKVYSFAYAEGSEAATTTEGTTETTTEAEQVSLVDINDVERATPGTASDGGSHTLWIVGDSTGCYYNETSRIINRNGFGMALGDDAAHGYTAEYKVFDNENLTVQNLAVSGRSSLDFLTDSNYATLTSGWKEGDYLIIAFGHNDEKNTDTARFTDASLGAEGWNTT
ncbi:MAG: hypothetical protein LIO44_01915, partial [Eubacterium sp.]|nr:hypothetical protein [Eubacterium sp.]